MASYGIFKSKALRLFPITSVLPIANFYLAIGKGNRMLLATLVVQIQVKEESIGEA